MEEERIGNEISRRRMLKRIGAGAAIAWTAPVLTSLRSPAFGQRYVACTAPCTACFSTGCPPASSECGQIEGGPICLCSTTTEGGCFCGGDIACAGTSNCTSSANCPAGWACMSVCCLGCGGPGEGTQCLPPCTEGGATTTSGRRASQA
jgi:hypothetical protein